MTPLFQYPLDLIMAGESPPGIPRRVAVRARYIGHIIACARSHATIGAMCEDVYHLEPDDRFAVFVNRRWIVTFDWDASLARAHSLVLEHI